ncbi:MAG: hypothetical protein UW37_C0014G0013 [Candidatus Gottesmanbacteria bacterium GW2011_GWA2_44_17]|uniref:DUF4446 domain-containing protein n=1 Tax=Candidatus Gottesmanbacteria bacterium GW2011_GWA2_44_17 TaxID=1618444 RepID=A0A0G1HIG0_9BACT|nr:MAG: hypothetical protein UW37_C0014G0013 [Candidatus Gottesmanbacteria bacterium GW2011_GWA2_44_17]
MSLVTLSIIIFGLWNITLSVLVFRMVSHYNRLTEGVSTHTLKESLEKILDAYVKNKKDIAGLSQSLTRLESEGDTHLQRIGIVRFNPFSDTGGSQSFTMALLDKGDNGVVMTSLYARTGNRWYIKYIKAGAGHDVELSKEEKAAIKNAK